MRFLWTNHAARIGRVALLGLALSLLVVASPLAAQDASVFTITVEGIGSASGEPNYASLQLGTEVVGTDLERSVDEVNSRVEAITNALTDLGVRDQDIQTNGIEITSQDLSDPNTGAITGELLYHVRSTLQVTTRDVSNVSSIITTAVDHGANRMSTYTLGIDDFSELEQAARQAAIANAYERAQALAAGLNLILADPITVSETIDNNGLPAPLSASDKLSLDMATEAPQDDRRPLVMTVRIQVVFRTRSQNSDSS